MSEGGETLSKNDQEMTKSRSPEFERQRRENPQTYSLLGEIHNKGERPTFYTFLSFLDSREADLRNSKVNAQTLAAVNRMRETTLNIASGRRNYITPADIDFITSYLSNYFDFWEKESAADKPEDQREIADNNTRIFEDFNNLLVESEIYKDAPAVYPKIGLEPTHVLERLKEVQDEEPDIESVLIASGLDNDAMKDKPEWINLQTAVNAARKYYESQKSSYEKQKKAGKNVLITITVKDGKVVENPAWSSDIIDANPAEGVFLFNPQGYEANPLSFDNAAKTVDEFDVRGKEVKDAIEALHKIQENKTITPDEDLALIRILQRHKDYFAAKVKEDEKPGELVAIENMLAFINKKLGREPEEQQKETVETAEETGAPDIMSQEHLMEMMSKFMPPQQEEALQAA